MPLTKAWENEKGELFHEDCFEKGESKEGYKVVDLNDLNEEDCCESCGGPFVVGRADDDDDDDEPDAEGNTQTGGREDSQHA